MLKVMVLELTGKKWASQIVFARMNDGLPYFVMNYRKLNFINLRDAYRILRVDECIYSSGEASKLSINNAYNWFCEVEIEDADCIRTGCTLTYGLQKFVKTLVGLQNTLQTVQQTMTKFSYRWMTVFLHIDRQYQFFSWRRENASLTRWSALCIS